MTGNAPIARRSRLKCCITPSPYTREERQYPTAFLYAAAAVRAERSVLPIRLRWLPLQRRDGAEGNDAREPVNEFRGRCLASTATQAPLQMLLWLQQLTQPSCTILSRLPCISSAAHRTESSAVAAVHTPPAVS